MANPRGMRPEEVVAMRLRVVSEIADELANSDRSLWEICDNAGIRDCPQGRAVSSWISQSEELQQIYARGKELQADYMAAQIRQIADNCRMGVVTVDKPTGVETTTRDMVDRSRLQIDARKWLAAKLAPKKYGDKIEQTLQNPDGSNLDLTINFVTSPKTDG